MKILHSIALMAAALGGVVLVEDIRTSFPVIHTIIVIGFWLALTLAFMALGIQLDAISTERASQRQAPRKGTRTVISAEEASQRQAPRKGTRTVISTKRGST
jgi:hypothetical protein